MWKFYGSVLKAFNSLKSTKGINMLGSPNTILLQLRVCKFRECEFRVE